MDFLLKIHNGECGLGGLFCDHQRDHGTSVLISWSIIKKLFRHRENSEVRIQDQEMNKESALS